MKPTTFLECELLAITLKREADRYRAFAEAATEPSIAKRHEANAESFERALEIIEFVGRRAQRLHLLEEPMRRESRFRRGNQ